MRAQTNHVLHCKLFYCGAMTELCCSARQKAAWPAAAGFFRSSDL